MNERTHFVYRVYDALGLLIYVGCTKNLEKRWPQHSSTTWRQYAKRVKAEGPYEKAKGFKRESEVIESERPYFNSLRDHKRIQQERWLLTQRLLDELRAARPDLAGSVYGTPLWEDFSREHGRIQAIVDATNPIIDDAWRHAHYLSERRTLVVASA